MGLVKKSLRGGVGVGGGVISFRLWGKKRNVSGKTKGD